MSSAERPDNGDERAEFDAIVSRLREDGWSDPDPEAETTAETAVARPEAPTAEEPTAEEPEPAADPVSELPAQWRAPTADSLSILDQEDEFVPEEPEPLPSGDLSFWGALAGLGGGILWVLYLAFFDRYASPLWWTLAILSALTGLVLVFLRQPDRRDDDWNDDVDGAVL